MISIIIIIIIIIIIYIIILTLILIIIIICIASTVTIYHSSTLNSAYIIIIIITLESCTLSRAHSGGTTPWLTRYRICSGVPPVENVVVWVWFMQWLWQLYLGYNQIINDDISIDRIHHCNWHINQCEWSIKATIIMLDSVAQQLSYQMMYLHKRSDNCELVPDVALDAAQAASFWISNSDDCNSYKWMDG